MTGGCLYDCEYDAGAEWMPSYGRQVLRASTMVTTTRRRLRGHSVGEASVRDVHRVDGKEI